MPRIDFESLPLTGPESWAKYYGSIEIEGYGPWMKAFADRRADSLVNGPVIDENGDVRSPHPFSFLSTDRILIVGCGPGYLIESFRALGLPLTWGIDYSTVMESSSGLITPGIEDEIAWVKALNTGQIRSRIRQVCDGSHEFDWIITEDVVPCYDLGAEMDEVFDLCEFATPSDDQIIHLVAALFGTNQDPDFLWMTLAQWKAIRPTNSWFAPNEGYRVL